MPRHEQKLRALLILVDAMTAACALVLADAIRSLPAVVQLLGHHTVPLDSVHRSALLAAVLLPAVSWCGGLYRIRWNETAGSRGMRVALAAGTTAVALIAAVFALRLAQESRVVMAGFWLFVVVGMFSSRLIAVHLARQLFGHHERRVVVIGSGPRALDRARKLAAARGWRTRIVGFLDDHPEPQHLKALGERYRGPIKSLADLHSTDPFDEILVALPRGSLAGESLANAIALAEVLGIDVLIAADLFDLRLAQCSLESVAGSPSLVLSTRHHHSFWALGIKRAVDLVGSTIGIVALLPLWIAIAIAIKRDSKGPVFFVQRRCGLHGQSFPCVKFRTMCVDAEDRLEGLLAGNEMTGPVFKLANDPRTTRVGRFLRKYSLDEFPQLLNVFVGQMSLVGPRPPIPSEVAHYELDQRRRLSMRPGITCLWQVAGRNLIPFEDWVRLDLQYIDQWSLVLDLEILLATIPAVLHAKGVR
ncbi:MAG: sugar transferase [Myxococcota bacterium]